MVLCGHQGFASPWLAIVERCAHHAFGWTGFRADRVIYLCRAEQVMSRSRSWFAKLRRTPFHPQWLMGARKCPKGLDAFVGKLLDVGAADQWLRHHLADHVDYVSLDYPATGRDLYGARPAVFADAACLPFADGSFEGVCCLEVIEHVPVPPAVFSEISRVLKRGGRAWVSVPFLYPIHDAPFDFRRFTEFGLRKEAKDAGFDVMSLERTGHALRAAGLLASLAVSGSIYERRGFLRVALLPVAAMTVLLINLAAAAASAVWPDWERMSMGYALELRKH